MKSIRSILHILLGVTLICSCNEATELAHITPNVSLIKYKDIVKIDSLYTYPGDSLYQNWINQYNKNLEDKTNMSIDIISMTKYNNIINIDSSGKRLRDSILSPIFHSYIFAMYKNESLWI